MLTGAALIPSPARANPGTTQPAATQPATQPSVQSLQWLGEPTRVTLSLKEVSPFDALKALETASRITLPLQPKELFDRQLGDTRISVEFANRTWLEAIVEIADKSNIRLTYYSGRWNVSFGGQARSTPRRHFAGPLLATCNRVMVEREVKLGQPHTTTQTLTLTGSLLAEPRVQSMQLERVAQFVEAIDDQGRPLQALVEEKPAGAPSASTLQMMTPDPRRDFNITMQVPNTDAAAIQRVKAIVRVAVLSRTESLQIPDVLNAEGFIGKIGDAKVKLERIDSAPQGYNLVVNIEPGSLPQSFLAGLRSNLPPFQPKIGVNGAGVATDVRVVGTGLRGDKSMQVTLMVTVNPQRRNPPAIAPDPDAANEPESNLVARPNVDLSWPLPMEYQQVDVPIEFTDIPLPK